MNQEERDIGLLSTFMVYVVSNIMMQMSIAAGNPGSAASLIVVMQVFSGLWFVLLLLQEVEEEK